MTRRQKRRGYCGCYLCLPGAEKKWLILARIAKREMNDARKGVER